MNLAQILAAAANEHGARTALHLTDGPVSFRELERRANAAAARLRDLGVERGDRVALKLQNGLEFACAWFGALRLGASCSRPARPGERRVPC